MNESHILHRLFLSMLSLDGSSGDYYFLRSHYKDIFIDPPYMY